MEFAQIRTLRVRKFAKIRTLEKNPDVEFDPVVGDLFYRVEFRRKVVERAVGWSPFVVGVLFLCRGRTAFF